MTYICALKGVAKSGIFKFITLGKFAQADVALTLKKIVIYTDRQTEHSFIIVDESKGLAIIPDLTAHGAIKNDYMAML